jgi:hypothetical protein
VGKRTAGLIRKVVEYEYEICSVQLGLSCLGKSVLYVYNNIIYEQDAEDNICPKNGGNIGRLEKTTQWGASQFVLLAKY